MIRLSGENFYLKTLTQSEVTDDYLSWLHDKEVNRFLEVRHHPPSREEAMAFIASFDGVHRYFFGIFTNESRFIGTLTLSIDAGNKSASYGYLVGDKAYWGTRAGVEAVTLMLNFAFETLLIRRVWGGAYVTNIGSIFNFKKLGFTQEGRQRAAGLLDGKEVDSIIFGILKKEWEDFKNKKEQNAKC